MCKIQWTKFSGVTVFVLFLPLFLATMMNAGEESAQAQSGHQITIKNNCSGPNIPNDKVWIGIRPTPMSVELIKGGTTPVKITTLGGWEMDNGDEADVVVPIGWTSGIIWARTGCNFQSNGVCPASKAGKPPANCCDTGGCTDGNGNFVINCVNTPVPPMTLAEFTMGGTGGTDTYDVSMVSGGNISIEIVPGSNSFDINLGIDPNRPSCTSDSDCGSSFPKCSTVTGQTDKKCVNQNYCSSPGCTDGAGCANPNFSRNLLESSTWGAITCNTNNDCGTNETCSSGRCDSVFAVNEKDCPEQIKYFDTQNQGTSYVGCITPQKFCRTKCNTSGNCDAPQECTNGFCTLNGRVIGADCDTKVGSGSAETSKNDLWGCTGTNSESCFTPGADSNCCGCPSWSKSFCSNGITNPLWGSFAEPIFEVFHFSAPPVYSFPFDDKTATYTCSGGTNNVTAYTITLCPATDTDGDGVADRFDNDSDNDGITDDDETSGGSAREVSSYSSRSENLNDIDGDGIPNELDLDSDGDCICDILEAGGIDKDRDCVVDNFIDSDGDGLNDDQDPDQGGVPLPITDTDKDGTNDFLDFDSDNDGVADTNETIGGMDVDGDGIYDDSEDRNSDGVADSCHPATGTPLEFLDSDGDGIFDHLDANDNTGQGNGGCSIAATAVKTSMPLYLLIPLFIAIRRAWGRTRGQ